MLFLKGEKIEKEKKQKEKEKITEPRKAMAP